MIYLDVPPKISQRLLTERYAGDTTKKTFTKATYIICYIAGTVHCTPQSI